MKIYKLTFPIILLLFMCSNSIYAQYKAPIENNAPSGGGSTSCSCSSPEAKCSASVTCSNGLAMCVCSENGCTSYCSGTNFGEFPEPKTLILRLQGVKTVSYSEILTKAIGKKISFVPFRDEITFNTSIQFNDHWDVLEYLSQNGDLKINGGDFIIWKRIREVVISGGANVCSGNATLGAFVNELSFFTGKKYQINGDPNSKLNMEVKGLNIASILETLQRNNQISVQP